MDAKFFDLSKNKQDKIIRSALKTFAKYGYRHASTDEIVAGAGVSKGLLFRYFESKIGLYSFICDYAARYLLLQLRTTIKEPSAQFYELMTQLLEAECRTIRIYPYLILFLESTLDEEDPEAADCVAAAADWQKAYRDLLEGVQPPYFMSSEDAGRLAAMIRYTRIPLMRHFFTDYADTDAVSGTGSQDPDTEKEKDSDRFYSLDPALYQKEMNGYIETLQKM